MFSGDPFFPPPLSCCVAVIEVPVPLPLNLEEYPRSQLVETSDSSSDSDSELPLSSSGIPDSQAKYVDQSTCPSIPFLPPSHLSLPPSFPRTLPSSAQSDLLCRRSMEKMQAKVSKQLIARYFYSCELHSHVTLSCTVN